MSFIGIPTYNGQIHYATVKGLLNVERFAGKHDLSLAVEVIPHDAFIGKARNIIAHKFLSSGFEDLIFIDADIGFDLPDFMMLAKADADIAIGLYRMKEQTPHHAARFPALMSNPVELHPKDDNLVRMEYGPTGFMKIRRKVFEAMMEKWPDDWFQDDIRGKMFDFFPCGRFGNYFVGEDIGFCNKARECGFQIWGVQDIALGHYGEAVWPSKWRVTRQIQEAA